MYHKLSTLTSIVWANMQLVTPIRYLDQLPQNISNNINNHVIFITILLTTGCAGLYTRACPLEPP